MKPRTAYFLGIFHGLLVVLVGWAMMSYSWTTKRHTPRNQYASRSKELAAEADRTLTDSDDLSRDVSWAVGSDDEPEDDLLRAMSLYEQAYYYDPSNAHVWLGFGRCYYALAMYRPTGAKEYVPQANYWLTRVAKVGSHDQDEAKMWLEILSEKYPQYKTDGVLRPDKNPAPSK